MRALLISSVLHSIAVVAFGAFFIFGIAFVSHVAGRSNCSTKEGFRVDFKR